MTDLAAGNASYLLHRQSTSHNVLHATVYYLILQTHHSSFLNLKQCCPSYCLRLPVRCACLLARLLLSALIHPSPCCLCLIQHVQTEIEPEFRKCRTSPKCPKNANAKITHWGSDPSHGVGSDRIIFGLPSAPEGNWRRRTG